MFQFNIINIASAISFMRYNYIKFIMKIYAAMTKRDLIFNTTRFFFLRDLIYTYIYKF